MRKEIVGASTRPAVIASPLGQIAVVQLQLDVREGPNTQKIEYLLVGSAVDSMIRVLGAAKAQMASIQEPPTGKH